MRRVVAIGALGACAFAGVFFALALTVPSAGADDGGGTTTTGPTDTAPPPRPRAGPRTIVAGVTVGGTLVGGLTAREARELLVKRFERTLPLVVSPTRRIKVTPREIGAVAAISKAVRTAVSVRGEGFRVPLSVTVSAPRLERYVSRLDRDLAREPADARLRLSGLEPIVVPSVPGRRLNRVLTQRAIRRLVKTHDRDPLALPFREVPALVPESAFDEVIVIRRESRKLFFYEREKLKRVFRVATGQSSYPTPLGRYEVVVKQRNPWWYPPQTSAWAQGKEPVPPGPGNPLGTRWMGISAPYVGIHGTPDAASIGYSASHGCVRMLIPEVEWLFERVPVGAPVFIVPA
ncbi:MAG: L,D-transpeptidase/peptidoglycan binding protein [Thermoleophilia bacterium]|nr:L,D-transpeptidase/peptidoglycan binding protein [Thermoleophilia bacterium]